LALLSKLYFLVDHLFTWLYLSIVPSGYLT
jgi:hypothetical protein